MHRSTEAGVRCSLRSPASVVKMIGRCNPGYAGDLDDGVGLRGQPSSAQAAKQLWSHAHQPGRMGGRGLGDLDDCVDEVLVEGVRRHQHHVQRRLLQRQRPRPARQRTSATGRKGQRDGGSRVEGSKLGHRGAEAPRRRAARRHGASLEGNGRKAGGESE
jgi:hypothetical protein